MPIHPPLNPPQAGIELVSRNLQPDDIEDDVFPPPEALNEPQAEAVAGPGVEIDAPPLNPKVLAPLLSRGATLADLEILPAHAVYAASFRRGADRLLDSPELIAWQYVIALRNVPKAVAEVRVSGDDGKELVFASLYPRTYAEAIVRTIAFAERIPEVRQNDYELRVLRDPSLSLLALWLYREGSADLLFPIRYDSKGRKRGPFSEAEMVAQLKPLAARRAAAPALS